MNKLRYETNVFKKPVEAEGFSGRAAVRSRCQWGSDVGRNGHHRTLAMRECIQSWPRHSL